MSSINGPYSIAHMHFQLLYLISTAPKYGKKQRPATCLMVKFKFLKHHWRADAGHHRNSNSLFVGIRKAKRQYSSATVWILEAVYGGMVRQGFQRYQLAGRRNREPERQVESHVVFLNPPASPVQIINEVIVIED